MTMTNNQPRILTNDLSAPYSEEAEEAVIGAVLINPNAYLTVASFLKHDDFYLLRHQYVWQALQHLSDRDEAIDFLTLTEELRGMNWLNEIGGSTYIIHLINNTPTSIHAEFYGRIVERTAIRRRLLVAADEIKALAVNETLEIESVVTESERRLFNVTDRQLRREFIPLRDAVSDYFDQIEHMMQNPQITLGVPSGFKDLDELLGGFQKSDLLIFAGRPGMGKCVRGDTLIHTAAGLLPIEALKPKGVAGIQDDEGGVYYPLNIEVMTPFGLKRTSHFYDSGLKSTLKVTTQSGLTLSGTYIHPIMVVNGGETIWKTLEMLQVGDTVAVMPELVTAWHTPLFEQDVIVSIENSGLQHCYDLTVPDGHAFVANGIVSHNTSFMLSTAVNSARLGARVAIFTMEMGADQLVQRMISMETGINSHQLRLGRLSQQEYGRFVEAAGRISRFQIFIDDTPALNPLQMRTKCRRLQHEHGLDLIMVDYLQLMNAGGTYENNRVQEISFISRALKELARELNVPIFSAAQLSRAVEQRQDKRPLLSDLRESGAIEQDSDIVMFLYRDIVYNEATEFPNQADVIVAKHRNGATGTVSLYFDNTLTKFMDGAVRRVDLGDV